MGKIKVDIAPEVFNEVYHPHLTNMARTQIFYGGSGSGKSVFLAQRAVIDVMQGGRNYLVCRAVGNSVRKSVFTEIKKVILNFGVQSLFNIKQSEGVIICKNGYRIIFTGLDDVEKVKSITPEIGAITDIWIEEATEVNQNTIKDLYKRQRGGEEEIPKRLTMSFNPILQTHWIYTEYFANLGWADNQTEYTSDELSIRKTWYIHNRWLTTDDVNDLLNEEDKYYREVYTFGNWGVLGNVIFTNWEVQDLSDMHAQFVNRRNGLDFGFSNDPAAMWVSHYDRKNKTIYLFDELYETGLTNDVLADRARELIGDDRLICDSAEPKSIAELRQHRINAVGAKKGKDSVLFGVQWLQQQKIIIDKRCVNAQNEFRQYKWKEDRNGIPVSPPRPIDYNNHIMDAGRYAHEEDMARTEITVKASVGNYLGDRIEKEKRPGF